MFRHQEVAEFLTREWQSISAAPITFLIAVVGVSALLGIVIGLLVGQSQGRSAQSKLAHLRELKRAEDDILDHVRAKHDLEVEARKEIEAELARAHAAVQRLYQGDLASRQHVAEAIAATARAADALKRSQVEFQERARGWDRLRASKHSLKNTA